MAKFKRKKNFINYVKNKFKTSKLAKYGYIMVCPIMYDLTKEEAKDLIEKELEYECQDIKELNYYIKVIKK